MLKIQDKDGHTRFTLDDLDEEPVKVEDNNETEEVKPEELD